MLSRDYRDIVGGMVLVLLGLGFSWYASSHYDMGTIRRMGPGMFPAGLGVLLAGFGALQAIPAVFRTGTMPEIRIWSPLFVLAGVAAFAVLVRPFGLMPAVLAVTVISSFAELKVRPLSLVLLAAALCLLSWLVFVVGLGMPVALFRWPF